MAVAVRVLALGLMVAAVTKELRKPRAERQWHGTVAGFVPYDFRLPTPDRVKASFWAPDSPRLLTPEPFGVGWSVNVGRMVRLASHRWRSRRAG